MSSVVVLKRKRIPTRWLITGILALVIVVAGGAVAYFSPLMKLETVSVEGTRLTAPGAVEKYVLDHSEGNPLPRIGLSGLSRDLLDNFTTMEKVRIRWSGLNSLHVTVTDKVPVAAVKSGAVWKRYSQAGQYIDEVTQKPQLTLIDGSDPAAIAAALTVVAHVEDTGSVKLVRAPNPEEITLVISRGDKTTEVRCGNTEDIDRKLQIAFSLLERADNYVDVSTPDIPVTG